MIDLASAVACMKNREEDRKVALAEEGLDNNTEINIGIPVSFDGTWSKRGFTANHGVSFVISAETGKVLDCEVVSKFCSACVQKKSTLSEDFAKLQETYV